MDLKGLVDTMVQTGAFTQLVNNPLSQFGTSDAPYLFADLLPERQVPINDYTEEGIRYRTVIANAGSRYSPAQKKGGAIVGAFKVSLGYSDIAAELTAADYDALIRAIERFTGVAGTAGGNVNRPGMAAMAQMTEWSDNSILQPLLSHNELQRSQALCTAQITLQGDNGFREVVNLPNPAGARVTAGGTWSNNTYDPYPDMTARVNFLAQKGYKVNRVITSTTVATIMYNNALMRQRAGFISIASGAVTGLAGILDQTTLNNMLGRSGIPPLELYDRVYFTTSGYGYYMPRDTMIFVCTTGRDERIERGDLEPSSSPTCWATPPSVAPPARVVRAGLSRCQK